MLAPLVLALCAACVRGQASTIGVPNGISVGATPSGSSSTTAPAATTTPPTFRILANSSYSAIVPSGVSVTAAPEAPNYSDSRWTYSFFSGYEPTVSTVEPEVALTDPLHNYTWTIHDVSPLDVPTNDTWDGFYLPPSINSSLAQPNSTHLPANASLSQFSTPASQAIIANATQQIIALINGSATTAAAECSTCKQALAIAHNAAQQVPWEIPGAMRQLCQLYGFSKTPSCEIYFQPNDEGAPLTQILYYATIGNGSYDGDFLCANFFKVCSKPSVTPYTPTFDQLVTTPRPENATAPVVQPGTPRLKVPHLSDIHLDTHYYIGSEANCTNTICCRQRSVNTGLKTTVSNASLPAPRYGSFLCDSPFELVMSALQSVSNLIGTPDFSIFTGDLTTHEPIPFTEVNTKYLAYEETLIYGLLKSYLGGNGSAPVYATISNHDSRYGSGWQAPQGFMSANLQALYQENYDTLSSLWEYENWLDADTAEQSRTHFTAYSKKTPFGLRIIGLNANSWYPSNIYNLINTSNADPYGMMAFTANELQKAEDAGERVWMIMHQPLGWTGQDNMPNPTDLMQQIVTRYSPHVIAALLNGHTHEDQFSIFYANNRTNASADTARAVSWAGPSITPGTNLNSGFKFYEVDSQTFDILESRVYATNVTKNTALTVGGAPEWDLLYSARDAYGGNISWPDYAPLNATWWALVTEQMEINPSLVEQFTLFDSKGSTFTKNCTASVCQKAKICYMRSGSTAQAGQCTPGYGSTQG